MMPQQTNAPAPPPERAQGHRVPAASRAAAVLRHLARVGRPVSAGALARELALPRTSVLGICDALADERMLARMTDGRFWLGTHVLELAAAAGATLERDLGIALLIASRANTFYSTMLEAAERELAASGGRLLVRDAAEDPAVQRAQWHEVLDDGADLVIVDSVDAADHREELLRSHEAGVPVVAVGSRLDGVDASVTSDNTQAGLLAGRYAIDLLGGHGRVALFDGLDKNANIDRIAGFREAIRDEPGMAIALHARADHDTVDAGRRMAARLIADHPDVGVVFAVCDPIAIGAAETLTAHGMNTPIISVDGRRDAIENMLSGGPIVASVAQEPAKIVRAGISIGRDLARGRPPVQGAHLIPVRLIDRDNVGGYEIWG